MYSFSMVMWELFACKRLYEGHIASQVGSSDAEYSIDAILCDNAVWIAEEQRIAPQCCLPSPQEET